VLRAGEGIFGLRRAFQIAGVRTVIVSLWPVEDRLAREWMQAMYASRLEQRTSTAGAVRDASRSLLSARRRRGGSTHPFYWSGFVAAGDWR
jgi:CHAT domain-containing protein